jgi:biopolymer transport protein ExbD
VVVTVNIDAEGTVIWNGTRLADRAALEAKLREAAAQPVQPEVHLRPSGAANYGAVAMVLASAQRVGVTKLGMVGNEQFDN